MAKAEKRRGERRKREKKSLQPLFADPANEGRPVCLPCVGERIRAVEDAEERGKWESEASIARATWELLVQSGKPFRIEIPDTEGWIFLVLSKLKWKRVEKGRCWRCTEHLAMGYLQALTEWQEASDARDYAKSCRDAAHAATLLVLEMDAIGLTRVERAADLDLVRGNVEKARDRHLATLRGVLKKPDTLMSQVFWRQLHRLLLEVLPKSAQSDDADAAKYDPLAEGARQVQKVAVALLQTANLESVTHHNFARVVEDQTKDPHNPPSRMALAKAFQWAQTFNPPIGHRELADILIEHRVADAFWGNDALALADSIKKAVKKYSGAGEIPSVVFAPRIEGSPPLQNR